MAAAARVRTAAPRKSKKTAAAKPKVDRAGGISDASVEKATGCGWDKWFRMLDHEGAAKLDHRGIVALVDPHLKNSGWWAQMITVAYEQARGLRKKHQKADGWSVSASKTIAVPVAELFRAFTDAAVRRRWLKEPLEIRKATPSKSVRIRWSDGTPVEVNLYAKGPAKSQAAVQQSRLESERAAAAQKAFWKDALERLVRTVAS